MISPAARIPIIWSLRDVKGRVTLSPTSVVFPSSVNNELLLWHSCKCEFHFEIGSQYLLHCYIDVKRKLSRLYDPFWGPSVPFGLVLTFIGKKCVSSLLWLDSVAWLICRENSFFVGKLHQRYFSHIKWIRFSLHHLQTFDALPSSITFTSNQSAHSCSGVGQTSDRNTHVNNEATVTKLTKRLLLTFKILIQRWMKLYQLCQVDF